MDLNMLRTLIALSVVFGLILADPLPKISGTSSKGIARLSNDFGSLHDYSSPYAHDDYNEPAEVALLPEASSLIVHVASALIGHKTTALSLAVKAIGWIVSNAFVIIIGSIVTLAFCKITGKCTLDYAVYEPVTQFRTLVTPQRLATAERFLVKAVEKYAEENNIITAKKAK